MMKRNRLKSFEACLVGALSVLIVHSPFRVSAVEYTAADYSKDGLVLQLDAIDNVGTGTHDPAAEVWKDLAGNYDFTKKTGGSWVDNYFYINNNYAATATKMIPGTYQTAEIVYASTGSKSGFILFTGYKNRSLYDEAGTRMWYSTEANSTGPTAQDCASKTATNHFAGVYASGSYLLDAVYADGSAAVATTHASDWNVSTTHAILGSRTDGQACQSQVKLFTIRLYNRKLSADEIRWHYALDRARFFGDTTLADQLRPKFAIAPISDQKILSGSYAEPRPVVTDETSGATLTLGTDYELSYRNNAAPGTATLTVIGKGAYVGQRRETTFEITRVRAEEYVSESYVQGGLICQLDGLDNVGVGLHDGTTNIWKDLKGDLDFTLNGIKGSFTENALSYAGSGAYATHAPPTYRTVEIVFNHLSSSGNGFVFYTYNKNRNLILYGSTFWFTSMPNANTAIPLGSVDAPHHFAGTYDGDTLTGAWSAAEPATLSVHASDYNNDAGFAIIGDRQKGSSWPTKGKIYALRLYDRELTPEELKWNYAVDRARFFNDRSEFCEMGVAPIPDQYAVGAVEARPEPFVTNRLTGATMVKGTDYSVAYSNNTSIGTGYVILTGLGDQTNTEKIVSFNISRPDIAVAAVAPIDVRGATRAEPKPKVTVAGTETELVENTDFTYAYRDNTAPGMAKVIVTGIGNYAGVAKTNDFTILLLRAETYTSENYIRNGLVMQLDGLDNAGIGLHDGTTNMWTDLNGLYDWALKSGGTWGTDCLNFNNNSAQLGTSMPAYRTVEAVFTLGSLTSGFLLYTPTKDRMICTRDNGKLWFQGWQNKAMAIPLGQYDSQHHVAATYEGSVVTAAYRDAKDVPLEISDNVFNESGTTPTIGIRANGQYGTKGKLYTLRFYDRELTQEEIFHNYGVDRARFFGDYSVFCDFSIDPLETQLYDGVHPVTPEPVVRSKADGSLLVKGVDYTVTYENNTGAGTATLKVTGQGVHAGMACPINFVIHQPIYVAPVACGTGDGSSWANAATLADALASVTKDDVVLVKAGTYDLAAGVSASVPFKLWGGYAGTASDPFQKTAGAKSTVAGGGTVPTLVTISADTDKNDLNEIRDVVFTGALQHGFVKSGKTGLLIEDCDFTENGFRDTTHAGGRGASLSGSATTVATLRNCRFRYNMETNSASLFGSGMGLNVSAFKQVILESCSFVGNGLAPAHKGGETQAIRFGSALYAEAPVLATDCEFRYNHAAERNDKRGGAVALSGGTGHVFSNCVFVANVGTFMRYDATTGGGTVRVALGDATRTATFERCTFAYNLSDSTSSANMNVVSGRAVLRNCIFSDAFVSYRYTGGRYVHVYSGAKCDVSDTLFPSGSEADALFAVRDYDLTVGKNVTYGDAAFVTPRATVAPWVLATAATNGDIYFDPTKTNELEAIDVHLRNSDGAYSAAIDQGAEEDAVGDEPAPNGNRLNLGAYAGTDEAAESDPDPATVANFTVSWPGNVSMPKFAFALGGAEDALYNADAEVYCATGAQITAGEWVKAGRFYGLHLGGSGEIQQTFPFMPGDDYKARLIVYNGATWVTNDITGTVGGELPPWYGKGGGAGVLHVWPDAVYEETGADWAHAYRTMSAALAAWTSAKGEIWIAGTNAVSASLATFKPSVPVVLRGGFTGAENTAAARPAGAYAQLDGQDSAETIFTLNNTAAAPVTFERIEFYRGYVRGLNKTGAGDITLTDCRFIDNARNTWNNTGGYGAWLVGTAAAKAVITNCWFEGQYYNSSCGGSQNNGRALYVQTFLSLDVVDSTFTRNGTGFFGELGASSPNRNSCGTTLCIEGAPTTLRRCDFRPNRGTVGGESKPSWGGIVSIGGASGGSLVENCLFLGNSDTLGGGDGSQSTRSGTGGGALVFRLTDAATQATVKNCTFAFNLSDAAASAAALTIQKGDVDVRNCIFHANKTGGGSASGVDIAFAADATGSVNYAMFDRDFATSVSVAGAAIEKDEATFRFGDPLLAVTNDMDTLTTATGLLYFKQTQATLDALLALDAHLRSTKGYWLDDGAAVTDDTVLSPAIDGADPADDYTGEPSPNGYRANLGRYGNTSVASKTPAGQPTVTFVGVEFVDGWTQPLVSVLLGGSGESYSATVAISLVTGGVTVASTVVAGVGLGGTAAYRPSIYLQPGDTLTVKVSVTATGADPVTPADTVTDVDAKLPPWYGKGGDPAKVIHVRLGATGTGDGSSWTDACTDLGVGLGKVTSDRHEVWFSGDLTLSSALAFTSRVELRGGFAGSENTPGERKAGARSVLSGQNAVETLVSLNNGASAPVTLDGLALVRAHTRAISKSASAGDLTLIGCLVASNGLNVCNDDGGHGMHVSGSGVAHLVVSNCVFRDQTYDDQCSGGINDGGAIKALSFAKVDIVGSSFVNNGATYGCGVGGRHAYRNCYGRAIYVKNSPVSLRDCAFLGNRGAAGFNGKLDAGGTVFLHGTGGGSEIRNCRFLGNANDFGETGGNQAKYSTYGGGALVLRFTDATHTAAVENCTFAWNVSDTYLSASGISVASGSANVRNCLFQHNRTGQYTIVAKDVSFAPGTAGSVAYALFDGDLDASLSISNAAVTVATNTFRFGDARPVSTNAMSDLVMTKDNLTYFKQTAATQAALEALDCHLRSRVGYVDEVTGMRRAFVGPASPAVDAGDPKSDYAREPVAPGFGNGRRVNLGAYGNTPWATQSRLPGSFLRVR